MPPASTILNRFSHITTDQSPTYLSLNKFTPLGQGRSVKMKMKPIVMLGLSAAVEIAPGRPIDTPREDSGKSPAQKPQQTIPVYAQHQETHDRLFGGVPGWITKADGSQVWVGTSSRN
jgi:hypothetical protein